MNYDIAREISISLVAMMGPTLPSDPMLAFEAISQAVADMGRDQSRAVLAYLLLTECGRRQTSSIDRLCGSP